MDSAVKSLNSIASDQFNKYKTTHKKDYQVGGVFIFKYRDMTNTYLIFDIRYNQTSQLLTVQEIARTFTELGMAAGESGRCLVSMGECYSELSSQCEKHAGKDWEPLLNLSHDYKGLVGTPPLQMVDDILGIQKCSSKSLQLNSTINTFINLEKMSLSKKKCHNVHIGTDNRHCPALTA